MDRVVIHLAQREQQRGRDVIGEGGMAQRRLPQLQSPHQPPGLLSAQPEREQRGGVATKAVTVFEHVEQQLFGRQTTAVPLRPHVNPPPPARPVGLQAIRHQQQLVPPPDRVR